MRLHRGPATAHTGLPRQPAAPCPRGVRRRNQRATPARALDGRAFGSSGGAPLPGIKVTQPEAAGGALLPAAGAPAPPSPHPPAAAAAPGPGAAPDSAPDALNTSSPPAPADAAAREREAWAAWLAFFDRMDRDCALADAAVAQLAAAVAEERYSDAARLKAEAAALAAGDAAAAARRALGDALASEDYAAAAALRDASAAWLEGWWWGRAAGDGAGHLLRVHLEHGRWGGRVFSARQIAEALGWHDSSAPPGGGAGGVLKWRGAAGVAGTATRVAPPSAARGAGPGGAGVADAAALQAVGAPLLEVFLRREEGGADAGSGGAAAAAAAAGLSSRPVMLWPPSGAEAPAGALRAGADPRALLAALGLPPPSSFSSSAGGRRPAVGGGAGGAADVAALLSELIGENGDLAAAADNDEIIAALAAAAEDISSDSAAGDLGPGGELGSGGDLGPQRGDSAVVVLTVAVDEDGVATITADEMPEADRAGLEEAMRPKRAAGSGAPEASAAEAAPAGEAAGPKAAPDGAAEAAAAARRLPANTDGVRATGRWAEARKRAAEAREVRRAEGLRLSKFESKWELDEVEATLRELRGDAPPPPPQRQPAQEQQQQQDGGAGAPPPAAARPRRPPAGEGFAIGPRESPMAAGAIDVDADAPPPGLARRPAELAFVSRDRFVLRPAAPGGGGDPADPRAPFESLSLAPNASAGAGGGAAGAAATTSNTTGGGGGEDEMWDRVADEVARMQEERSGVKVERAALADTIRAVAARLVGEGRLPAGGVTRVRIVAGGAAGVAATSPAAPRRTSATPASPPAITYTRIAPEAAAAGTDPFSGLYLGSFGSHGPELLQLVRGTDEDGDECVEGFKVTGDENVPCGQLSFRAKVGRRHKGDPKTHYPEEMGVAARYPGQGRIADADFANPKWVDGELLLFSPSANPLVTGGARVGFVWSVPNDRRFLILLNRVQLA